MAVTKNYRFPIIDPKDKFDGAEHVNELAREIDHVMQHVEEVGKDSHYVLPPATKHSLGGVIAGDNVQVADDGTISVSVNPYVLPPASYTTLGGVIVERNGGLQLDENGTIHIDNTVIGVPAQSVTTEKITDNAITTTKLADGSVTYEKLSTSLKKTFDDSKAITEGNPNKILLDTTVKNPNVSNLDMSCFGIAGFNFIDAKFELLADGSTSKWRLCRNPYQDDSYSKYRGFPVVAGTATNKVTGTTYPVMFSSDAYDVTYRGLFVSSKALPAGSYNVEMHTMFFHSEKLK